MMHKNAENRRWISAASLPAALPISALLCLLMLSACSQKSEDNAQVAAGAAPPATASNVPGQTLTITNSAGQALVGAMISQQVDDTRRVTRFTDTEGQINLDSLPGTRSELWIRYPGMQSVNFDIQAVDKTVAMSADKEFLRHLPSSAWLSLLPEDERKREFIINCGTCHEIAHDRIMLNGRPRSTEEWLAAIAMMRAMDAYEVIPPDFDDAGYARWLAENLSAERIATLTPATGDNAEQLAAIEITEYELPLPGSLPHDLVTGPDGRIWITAFFNDELWALTPDTGDIQRYSVDTRADINAQPRALEFDSDGILWLVNGGTQSVLRFDPGNGEYDEIPVGMYAHSIDLGPTGDIWVNDYFAAQERIARVSAKDFAVTSIPVPPANRPESEGVPLPYGLQVDSLGRVYSTQLAANTLVRYDSRDASGTLFEMPETNSGPRRPGLDNRDQLWIPEFNTGALALFSPETETFDRIQLGSSSIGLYDVEVNQANNEVWATGSLASTLIRYRPDSGDALTIPLPTEPAYTRHIAIDEASGDVWSAYSSLPAAEPKVVRVRVLK